MKKRRTQGQIAYEAHQAGRISRRGAIGGWRLLSANEKAKWERIAAEVLRHTFDSAGFEILPGLRHTYFGNCFVGRMDDVCLRHEEPRGSCSVCERCLACEKEGLGNLEDQGRIDEGCTHHGGRSRR